MSLSPRPESPDHLFSFEFGDTVIHVIYKGYEVVGKVASTAMALACPAWGQLLSTPPKHPDESSNILDFTDDNGDALLILLQITHLRFGAIKSSYDYSLIFHVAVLCEKYSCLNLVKPWLNRWLPSGLMASVMTNHHLLYIAWAFGDEILFKNVATRLVTRMRVAVNGQPFTTVGFGFPRPHPDGIVDNIMEIRHQLVIQLLELPYQDIKRYSNALKEGRVICSAKDAGCDRHFANALIQELKDCRLWPSLAVGDVFTSVDILSSDVRRIQVPHYGQLQRPTIGPHSSCGIWSYGNHVNEILLRMPNPVEAYHIKHMREKNGSTQGNGESTAILGSPIDEVARRKMACEADSDIEDDQVPSEDDEMSTGDDEMSIGDDEMSTGDDEMSTGDDEMSTGGEGYSD